MNVTEPIGHGSGFCNRIWRIKSRVAISLENAANVLNSGADFGGIIAAALRVPITEDIGCSFID
jgi:hypothetical protein